MAMGFGGGAGKPQVSLLKDNVASIATANCKTNGGVGPYDYHLDFYNGLVVTISGAGSDTTIVYE